MVTRTDKARITVQYLKMFVKHLKENPDNKLNVLFFGALMGVGITYPIGTVFGDIPAKITVGMILIVPTAAILSVLLGGTISPWVIARSDPEGWNSIRKAIEQGTVPEKTLGDT